MIKTLVKEKAPLQFSTMLYPILHWGLENSWKSNWTRTPKNQKRWLSPGDQELHAGWCELKIHKILQKSQFKNSKNCSYIYSQHISTLMVTQNNAHSGNTLPHTLPPHQGNMSKLNFCCTDHNHRQHLVPPLMHHVFFHQQLWMLPFLRCLRNTAFLPWAWWSQF